MGSQTVTALFGGLGFAVTTCHLKTHESGLRSRLQSSANSTKASVSVDKTLEKLLRGESDANIRFDEICQLLEAKGFRMRVSGSHHIFTKSGVMERINLQREGSKAKPYQVRQVRKILAQYKLL